MIAGTIEIQMMADMARLQADMNRANAVVGGAMASIERAVASAKAALVGLSVVGIATSFAAGVRAAIDQADALNDLSKTTGIAVDALAGLKLAAQQSGGDLEGIAASINKLSVAMGKDAERFTALGVTSKEPLEAFKQLADVFSAIADPQLRAALGAEALGKSWASAAPLLAEGGARISQMVERGRALASINQDLANRADEFNDKLAEFNAIADGAKMRLAGEMLPAMTDITKAIVQAYEESGKLNAAWVALGSLGAFAFTDEFSTATVKMQNLRKEIDDLYKSRALAATPGGRLLSNLLGTEEEFNARIKDAESKVQNLQDLMDKPAREAAAKAAADQAAAGERKAAEEKARAFLQAKELAAAAEAAAKKAAAERERELAEQARLIADLAGLTGSFAKDWENLTALYKAGKLDMQGLEQAQAKLLAKQPAIKEMHDAEIKYAQEVSAARVAARAKEEEGINAYMLAQEQARHQEEKGAQDALKAAEDLYKQYGKSKSQIEELVVLQLKLQQAKLREFEYEKDAFGEFVKVNGERVKIYNAEYASLQRQIEMREKLVTVLADTEALDRQKEVWQSIEQTAHTTFTNIFQGGQDAFTKLRDTLKATLLDLLYQMTVKKWIFDIAATVSGDGVASSAIPGMNGSGGTGMMGLFRTGSNLNSMYNTGSSLYTVGSQVLGGTMSGANAAGTVYANTTGGGLDALLSTNSAYGTAAPSSTGALSGAGTSMMAFIPFLLAAYGASKDSFRVSSTGDSTSQFDASGKVINRRNQLFGGDNPVVIPSIVNGVAVANPQTPSSFTTNELALTDGHTQEQLDTLYAAQSATRDAQFLATNAVADKYTEGLNAAYLQAAKNLGVGAVGTNITFGTNDTRGGGGARLGLSAGSRMFDSGDISLNDADLQLAANRAILTALEGSDLPKWMQGVFDGVDAAKLDQAGIDAAIKSATDLRDAYNMLQQIPGTDLTGISFETLNSIKDMAAELVTVNTAFYQFGYTMLDVSSQGAQAATDLVNAFGGMQAAQAQFNSFAQNYLSPDELQANTYAIVQSDLQKAGISVTVDQLRAATRQDIRAAVDSLSGGANTSEGAAQYAAAVQAANTLAGIKPALDAIAATSGQPVSVGVAGGWVAGSGGGGGGVVGAANELTRAFQSLTDAMFKEEQRVRDQMAGDSSEGLARSQARLATAHAMARAGDKDAAAALPQLNQAMLLLAESNARTLDELNLIRGRAANSLHTTGTLLAGQYGLSIPSFDIGTNMVPRDMLALIHAGEAIVPQAYNPALGGGGMGGNTARLEALVEALTAEVASLKEPTQATADNTVTMKKVLVSVTQNGEGMLINEDSLTDLAALL